MLIRQKWLLQWTKVTAQEAVGKTVLLHYLESIEKLFVVKIANLPDCFFKSLLLVMSVYAPYLS